VRSNCYSIRSNLRRPGELELYKNMLVNLKLFAISEQFKNYIFRNNEKQGINWNNFDVTSVDNEEIIRLVQGN
jgi:hypothetical protein